MVTCVSFHADLKVMNRWDDRSFAGVTVTAANLYNNQVEEYRGDAVLCTLPLGVLKRSLQGHEVR